MQAEQSTGVFLILICCLSGIFQIFHLICIKAVAAASSARFGDDIFHLTQMTAVSIE